jgi:hypothetical protein
MINICVENKFAGGLGDMISLLSVLTHIANTGEQITVFTRPEKNSKIEDLVDIYKLSEKINIIHINIPGDALQFQINSQVSCVGKSFSPYIKHPNINVTPWNKRYIAVALCSTTPYTLVKQHLDNGNTSFPFNRYHDTNVFAYICKIAKELDYDVISVDSFGLNLTEKINFLNNHCAAVIGYEGGMAHVAHTLDIPCVILPPRQKHGPPYTQMHLDTRTYFLQDIAELFSWNAEMLEKVIDDLTHHKGNNDFLDENMDITVTKGLHVLKVKNAIHEFHQVSILEHEWINKYFINNTESTESVLIGGIRKVLLSPMVYNEFFLDHYNAAPDPIIPAVIPTIIPTPPAYNKYNPAPTTDIPTIIPTYNKYK